MTIGRLLFCAGAGMFVLAVILAVVFAAKKIKYQPETGSAAEKQRDAHERGRNSMPDSKTRAKKENRKGLSVQEASDTVLDSKDEGGATTVLSSEAEGGATTVLSADGIGTVMLPEDGATELM